MGRAILGLWIGVAFAAVSTPVAAIAQPRLPQTSTEALSLDAAVYARQYRVTLEDAVGRLRALQACASFSDRIERYYVPRSRGFTIGENLAMFGGPTPSAGAVVDAWMGSPSHRANLLQKSFHDAGVAIVFNPAAGGVFGGESTWIITLDLGTR